MLATRRIITSGLGLSRLFHRSAMAGSKKTPNPWVLATGQELWEALEHKKGNVDPYLVEYNVRGPGTRECPNVVLSPFDSRLVGCICNDEVNHVIYFWVHECEPKRCLCNYWFVLERFELPKIYQDTCEPECEF